jgi:hypothetical protein
LPSPWNWIIVASFAYSLASTPFVLRRILGMYWNAPEAAEANRRLVA